MKKTKKMKKIIVTLLLISNIYAYQVFNNINKAINYATEIQKPILLFIYSPTCPHCSDYFYNMRMDRKIGVYIATHYVVCLMPYYSKNIPNNIDFTGIVPYTDILFYNGKPIAPSIKGEIPMNYLYQYLIKGYQLFETILSNLYQNY